MTIEMVSVGPVSDLRAFNSELEIATAQLKSSPRLAIVYLPVTCDAYPFLQALRKKVSGPVVGATTGGAAFTEKGFTRHGAVAALLGGEGVEFSMSVATEIKEHPSAALFEALRSLPFGTNRHVALMTLADAFAVDGEALVTTVRRVTPLHCNHFGGTAGDDWMFQGTKIFAHDRVLSDAAVFVCIATSSPLSMAVRHGWLPARLSQERTVTSAKGNVLQTLDNRPALDVYREELQRLGLWCPGEEIVKVLARYELGLKTPFGDEMKIRAPLAVSSDRSITLASSIAEGTVVRIVTASSDQLIQAAKNLAKQVYAPLNSAIHGTLVFDCAARLQLLQNRYHEQVEAFLGDDYHTHPMIGFACYGEIAKCNGSIEGFHNSTTAMVAW